MGIRRTRIIADQGAEVGLDLGPAVGQQSIGVRDDDRVRVAGGRIVGQAGKAAVAEGDPAQAARCCCAPHIRRGDVGHAFGDQVGHSVVPRTYQA